MQVVEISWSAPAVIGSRRQVGVGWVAAHCRERRELERMVQEKAKAFGRRRGGGGNDAAERHGQGKSETSWARLPEADVLLGEDGDA